jgi:hypothetical protein
MSPLNPDMSGLDFKSCSTNSNVGAIVSLGAWTRTLSRRRVLGDVQEIF